MDGSIEAGWVGSERVTIHKEEKTKEGRLEETLTRHQAVDGHIGSASVCPHDLCYGTVTATAKHCGTLTS